MRLRTLGWIVSLGVFAGGLLAAAVTVLRDGEHRRRAADSARLLRDRATETATDVGQRTAETAQDLRDRWTETALEVRERWTTTAEEVRAKAHDTALDWRDRSAENLEQAIRETGEAIEEGLADLPDVDDAEERPEGDVEQRPTP